MAGSPRTSSTWATETPQRGLQRVPAAQSLFRQTSLPRPRPRRSPRPRVQPLAHVTTTVYVPGVALPGTLVRPSFDCESVEAMSDEKPDGEIHSATSGGWRTAETR